MHRLDRLRKHFGTGSALAQEIVPTLYNALSPDEPALQRWRDHHLRTLPKKADITALAAPYALDTPAMPRLIFALQTYYALIVKLFAAQAVGGIPTTLQTIENGTHFTQNGVHGLLTGAPYDWYLKRVDVQPITESVMLFSTEHPLDDPFKPLYQDLFPRKLRHALGEYYTPDWLAAHVLNRLGFDGNQTLLDPACGSGTFLVQAMKRIRAQGIQQPLTRLAGIDLHPLACLSAGTTLLLHSIPYHQEITLPIYYADSIVNPPAIAQFDMIAGNPPWVNWETLPDHTRQQTKHLWIHYGLFPHRGMEAILGKGKKDLSLLMTYAVCDQHLREGGKLGFILTDAALKTSGAGAGFRRLQFHDTPLAALHVDDLSRVNPFSGAATNAVVLVLEKGARTQFPVPYVIWRKRGRGTRITADHTLGEVRDNIEQTALSAQPINKPDSAWMRGKPAALDAVDKLRGTSDYQAHAGVYTGGANAVYWLDVLDDDGSLLHVQNIVSGAKRAVKQVEITLESEYVYPLLRGRDVRRWKAIPTAHILVVQDPESRRGIEREILVQNAPKTLEYLAQFEKALRQRAAYRRYFSEAAPFWTMFDVGAYTFQPYKVVWKGFGARTMQAAVIGCVDDKPIMSNQAMHPFIGLDDADEAHYLAACLNSLPFEFAVLCHTQAGGKSFAQPGILNTLRIPRYNPQSSVHRDLVKISRQAHDGVVDDASLNACAAILWDLSDKEHDAIRHSHHALRP